MSISVPLVAVPDMFAGASGLLYCVNCALVDEPYALIATSLYVYSVFESVDDCVHVVAVSYTHLRAHETDS